MADHLRTVRVLLAVLVIGCERELPPYPVLDGVTRIDVRVRVGSRDTTLAPITDRDSVERIVAFVNARRDRWTQPWYGVPVPRTVAELYNGSAFVGHIGAGANFLETQRLGDFASRSASPEEVATFNALVGVDSKVIVVPHKQR